MKLVTQAQLDDWLDALAQKFALIAPVEMQGKLFYKSVTKSSKIAWGFERTDMSPKTWLFPATEPILTVEQGDEIKIKEVPAPAPKVVFGVRPCDARGALGDRNAKGSSSCEFIGGGVVGGEQVAFPQVPQEVGLAVTVKIADVPGSSTRKRMPQRIHGVKGVAAVNQKTKRRHAFNARKRLEIIGDIEGQTIIIHR